MSKRTPKQTIEALIEAGETQVSIQNATGISQATISRILSGIAEEPRYSTVEKLNRHADQVLQRRKTKTAA